jgi:uncharacterized coiled-coil DUF342 family protein
MTTEDLDQIRAIVRDSHEHLAEAIIGNLADLRREMNARFDQADTRFQTLERRAERLETHMQALVLQTAGMSKSLTDAERLDTSFAATQAAQQKAIDDLYQQIAELKRRLSQQ